MQIVVNSKSRAFAKATRCKMIQVDFADFLQWVSFLQLSFVKVQW